MESLWTKVTKSDLIGYLTEKVIVIRNSDKLVL
jgi:hypothetical protein